MRAFIIRPFSAVDGIDFNQVQRELILPALEKVGLVGATTEAIVEAGNIREDMFRELIEADVVIADVSVENANVYYELGIRHALRGRVTVMIRAKSVDTRVPFDLATDRQIRYPYPEPGAGVNELAAALARSMKQERIDSPVLDLLPGVRVDTAPPQLPRALHEAIDRSREARCAADLRVIAEEVRHSRVEEPALRLIGAALKDIEDYSGARDVWERVRTSWPQDLMANRALSDIYRRLADADRRPAEVASVNAMLFQSDQAIDRVLGRTGLAVNEEAELRAMRGANAKRRWRSAFEAVPLAERQQAALQSLFVYSAFDDYRRAFTKDLNHWYSGINALALAVALCELAEAQPEAWADRFQTDEEADAERKELEDERNRLTTAVRISVGNSRRLAVGQDRWLLATEADLLFLVEASPQRVQVAYRQAAGLLSGFERASVRQQLELFESLSLRGDLPQRALAELSSTRPPKRRTILFAGHMLDEPGGTDRSRFPSDYEPAARAAIAQIVAEIRRSSGGDLPAEPGSDESATSAVDLVGAAGATHGGDVLFHEVCQELGIPTEVLMPFPEQIYRATAVSGRADEWVERYHRVRDSSQVFTMLSSEDRPAWQADDRPYDAWERTRYWMLEHAAATSGDGRFIVVVLWDGREGGWISKLVHEAKDRGVEVRCISTAELAQPTGDRS